MLVDKMEYQGQQGGGSAHPDAFYELLSSTALAQAKQHQHHQLQHLQHQHQQQEWDHKGRGEEEMVRAGVSEEVLPSYDFQTNSGSYGGVTTNGEDAGQKSPAMAPVVPSYPTGPPLVVIG